MLLLDTSALLEGEREGIILMSVIRELDNLKTREGLVGKKARDTIKYIYQNCLGNIEDESASYQINLMPTDQILLNVANEKGYTLVTADLSLFLQARARKIKTAFIESDKNGFKLAPTATYLTPEEYTSVLTGNYEKQHPENHFLIYGDEAFKIINGTPTIVKYRKIKNEWIGEVKPRNVEQKCLLDLLHSDTPVVAVHSKFGCGKSYLMLNYILSVLGEGKQFDKLIVIPNNSAVSQSREVGTLPGDILEKEMVYLGPLIDLLGPDRIRDMMAREQLEVVPIAFARGRNWDNAIVFVSESQNLTSYHMKLLLGRIGENSRIFFDGDVRQEDNKVFTENSGLVLLHRISETESSHMFGSVELRSIERSAVARLADVLDKITG